MVSKGKVGLDRGEKVKSRTSSMHAVRESYSPIVPQKQANEGPQSRPERGRRLEESDQERGLAKGNAEQSPTTGTQSSGKQVSRGLIGVREAAERDRQLKFTALLHHLNEAQLAESFGRLKRDAAAGVDGVTWEQYQQGLEDRLVDLHGRIHRGSYRAQPGKRSYIAKEDGQKRLLGISALEDKIVQQALSEVLNQIYEVDFMGFSYGFRPKRSQHHALDALWVALVQKPINWVLDMDIKGFFDHIQHDWLLQFMGHRVADKRVLRLIKKWLRAGISEQGNWEPLKEGTPQGAVISPLLANIYLHYAFDLWAHKWREHQATGAVVMVRYADDIIVGFESKADAERFRKEVAERIGKFGLQLHPDKTRLIEFGRYAAHNRQRRGKGKPETFDFLGFTHIGSFDRGGRYTVRRKTKSKKIRGKLKELKAELRRRYHQPVPVQGKWLKSAYQGFVNYFAVPGNMATLKSFHHHLCRIWLKALRRRSQKGRKLTWGKFEEIYPKWLPQPRCKHPWPNQRFGRHYPRQEPYAVVPHVRVCAGGVP
jgi:RNA-directed DNA polymerase